MISPIDHEEQSKLDQIVQSIQLEQKHNSGKNSPSELGKPTLKMSYHSGIPELDININLDKGIQNDVPRTVYADLEKQTISPTWSPIAPIQGNQHLVTNQQYMKIVTSKNNWSMSKTDQSFAKYKQQLMQGKDPGIRVVKTT